MLDSSILKDAVARQYTVTHLVTQICRVGRETPGADLLVATVTGHDYSKPGKLDIAWDGKATKENLVADALTLLASINIEPLPDKQQETGA